MPIALFQRMVSKLLGMSRPGALRADPIRLRPIDAGPHDSAAGS
jgi:hypothetical protein